MFKIGDKIRRKDLPNFIYTIVGENKEWNAWYISEHGMVFKDDERWEKVEEPKKE